MPRNFAIRLSCPHGDSDSWVTLPDRDESFEQIREQTWEFNCREHGAQRGMPREVIEMAALDDPRPSQENRPAVPFAIPLTPPKKIPRSSERVSLRVPVVIYGWTAKTGAFHEEAETVTVNSSGALVTLKTKLEVGDTVFLIHKSSRDEREVRVSYLDAYSDRETRVGLAFKQPISDFWRKTRKRPRIPKSFRVIVKGIDSRGNPFAQTAHTVDLSKDGARLDGVGFLTAPGQTIEVRRRWRKARFRVIWIGQIGTTESNQVGLFGLDSDKNIWHIDLPEGPAEAQNPPQNPNPASDPKPPKK